MSSRFIADSHPDALYESWTEALRKSCGEYETTVPAGCAFEGNVDILSLDDTNISCIESNATKLSKRRLERGEGSEDHYFVVLQSKGAGSFQQFGHEVELFGSDITVMDQRYPCEFQLNGSTQHLSFEIPSELYNSILGAFVPRKAIRIDTRLGFSAVLRRYIQNTYMAMRTDNELNMTIDQEALVKLLGDSLGLSKSFLSNKELQNIHFNEVKCFIERNIRSHALNADVIAGANSLSRRKLFRLFQQVNTTPYKWVKKRRLALARKVLLSASFETASISEVADFCGFSDLAYFTREFAEEFQQPPARYRESQ